MIATCDPVCYYNKATPVAVLSQFNFGEIDMDKIQSSEAVFVSALYKFVSEQIQDLKEGLEISNLPKFNMQNKYRRGELDAYTTVAYKIEGWRDEFDEPYADIPDVDGDIEYPAEVWLYIRLMERKNHQNTVLPLTPHHASAVQETESTR